MIHATIDLHTKKSELLAWKEWTSHHASLKLSTKTYVKSPRSKKKTQIHSPIPPPDQHKPQRKKEGPSYHRKQILDEFLLQGKETSSFFYQKGKMKASAEAVLSQEKSKKSCQNENYFETYLHQHPLKKPHSFCLFTFQDTSFPIPASASLSVASHPPGSHTTGDNDFNLSNGFHRKKSLHDNTPQVKFRQKQVIP